MTQHTPGNEPLAERFRLLRAALDAGDTCAAGAIADECDSIGKALVAACRNLTRCIETDGERWRFRNERAEPSVIAALAAVLALAEPEGATTAPAPRVPDLAAVRRVLQALSDAAPRGDVPVTVDAEWLRCMAGLLFGAVGDD